MKKDGQAASFFIVHSNYLFTYERRKNGEIIVSKRGLNFIDWNDKGLVVASFKQTEKVSQILCLLLFFIAKDKKKLAFRTARIYLTNDHPEQQQQQQQQIPAATYIPIPMIAPAVNSHTQFDLLATNHFSLSLFCF